ncbi:hypothetical protein BS639_24205 [Rouxiella silvae]|uniref:TrfB transcriptional repressor protein domain-containing protein n=1 Tax=Rouxiella silvae TaxID=1646373 RepID=A0ABX3TTV3_9GAMM|nr:TrfB-related DNA-binding protein [Rouxiella silvae]ORJ18638.1 hypothetical protein BS639_24205 [Rouxiella silvae]
MDRTRITPSDWERALPAFESLTQATVNTAYAVLVEGRRAADVAREKKKTRQAVSGAVARVLEILKVFDLQELEPVSVWLPPHLADEVRKMAEPYMPKITH